MSDAGNTITPPFVPQQPGGVEAFNPALWGLAEDEAPPAPTPATPPTEETPEETPQEILEETPPETPEPETLDQTLERLFEERQQQQQQASPEASPEGGGETQPEGAAAQGTEPASPPSAEVPPQVTPPAPGPQPQPAPQPQPQPQVNAAQQAADALGVPLDQLQAALQVHTDLQGLAQRNPAAIAQLEGILYPQAPPAPGTYPTQPPVPQPQQPWQQQAPYQQQPYQQQPFPGADDELVDPALQAALAPVQQQLTQFQQWAQWQEQQQQAQAQAQAEQHRQQVMAQINNGAETFALNFGLTPEEKQQLEQKVVDSGIVAGLYSQHGDGDKAMQAAMAQMYWVTPEFRSRELQRQQAREAAEDADVSQRARKAGALAGGSATVTREQTPPQTPQDRRAAMVAEIAGALSGDEQTPATAPV